MRKTLITFGDENFAETRERFRKEAVASRLFDEVIAFGPEDLKGEFWAEHGKFVEKNPRGFGFWLWKPYLIRRTLEGLREGDVLVYADAGCAMNPKGAVRWDDYGRRVAGHPSGILAFELTGIFERAYTKMDVFEAMGAKAFLDRSMHMATVIVFRKCAAALEFVREWEKWCGDYRLISDQSSVAPNHPDFVSHRHDQSIFSLLCKMRGVDSLIDETFGDGAVSPILVKRLRPKLGVATKLKRSILKRRAAVASRLGLRG